MRAKDFIKEDHGFLAPGSHEWEGKVGQNILNQLKKLPSGAWAGFKNIVGLDDGDQEETPNLAKSKVDAKIRPGLRKSTRTGRSVGRTSRLGGEDDQ